MERSTVTAFLGPTNTGKTHRAVLRMLKHDTGAIGLPLRLLAREVYDKVREKVGAERVALVTGEERRVPRAPSYWISTTEAMDTERSVDFVAVDEVQLMEDRERGHVFTDRVLHARGRRETIFLGSLAAREVLLGLVPHAVLEHAPRLSRLSHAGALFLDVARSMGAVVELGDCCQRVARGQSGPDLVHHGHHEDRSGWTGTARLGHGSERVRWLLRGGGQRAGNRLVGANLWSAT